MRLVAARKTLIVEIISASSRISVVANAGAPSEARLRVLSIPVRGDSFDRAIQEEIARRHHLTIGNRTAELVKMGIGNACPPEEKLTMDVRGRDEASGVARIVTVTSHEIHEAIKPLLEAICAAVRQMLAELPPAWAADIADNGIHLGGGTLLKNLDRRLLEATGLPVHPSQVF